MNTRYSIHSLLCKPNSIFLFFYFVIIVVSRVYKVLRRVFFSGTCIGTKRLASSKCYHPTTRLALRPVLSIISQSIDLIEYVTGVALAGKQEAVHNSKVIVSHMDTQAQSSNPNLKLFQFQLLMAVRLLTG